MMISTYQTCISLYQICKGLALFQYHNPDCIFFLLVGIKQAVRNAPLPHQPPANLPYMDDDLGSGVNFLPQVTHEHNLKESITSVGSNKNVALSSIERHRANAAHLTKVSCLLYLF